MIYILEALIFEQYCSELFYTKYAKKTEYLTLFSIYIILFLISSFKIVWLNLILFLLANFSIILLLYHVKRLPALFHSSIITIVMGLSELVILGITSHSKISFYEEQAYLRNFIILTVLSKLIYFFILHIIVRLLNGRKEKDIQILCQCYYATCRTLRPRTEWQGMCFQRHPTT